MSLPTSDSSNQGLPLPGDSYVQSFARGLAVIRTFSAEAPQQTLTEVAQRAGLTRAGARRILLTLQTLGYVASDGRQFRLTPRILDLGFAYLSSMPIWNLAEPQMEELVGTVKESSSVAVLDGIDIVYVLRVPTHKIMRMSLSVGSRLPAAYTSMGRVLLAYLPQAEARAILCASDLRAHTRSSLTTVEAISEELVRVREQGYALVDQEFEEGLISIAAPIRNPLGKVHAAINVSGQANRTSPEYMKRDVLPTLLATAQRISQLMVLRMAAV